MNDKEYIQKLIEFFTSLREELYSILKCFQAEYEDFRIEDSCKMYHTDIEQVINDYVSHFLKIHREQLTLSYPILGIYDFPRIDELSANCEIIKITPHFFVNLHFLGRKTRLFTFVSEQITNIIAEEVVKRINTRSLSDCEVVSIMNYKALFINNEMHRLRSLEDFDRWITEINILLDTGYCSRPSEIADIYYSVKITEEFDITALPKIIPLRYVEEDYTIGPASRICQSVDCSVRIEGNEIVLCPLN